MDRMIHKHVLFKLFLLIFELLLESNSLLDLFLRQIYWDIQFNPIKKICMFFFSPPPPQNLDHIFVYNKVDYLMSIL